MVLYFIIQRIIVILTMILFFVWILYGTLNMLLKGVNQKGDQKWAVFRSAFRYTIPI